MGQAAIKEETKVSVRGGLPTVTTDVSQESKNNLIASRIDCYRTFPFIGFLIMSTEYHFSNDIPTMAATCVGGNKVYVNESFLNGMTREERNFVLFHELLHIFLMHVGRQREHNYHPALWNIATDFNINSFLKEIENCSSGKSLIKMPTGCLYDVKYKNMSSDLIYHKLMEEVDNIVSKAIAKYGEVGKEGSSGMAPLDEVDDTPMTDSEKTEIKQQLAASMSQCDKEAVKKMGDGFADMIRAFEDLIESVIPWQTVLRDFVTTSSKNVYTYNRVSRKSSGGIIFPTLTGDHVSLVVGIDTSGSMSSKDLGEAMSELYAIVEEYDSWNLQLISCDTHAHFIGEYASEDGDDFSTIDKNLIGGGGTSLESMIEYANESEEDVNVCIILTDGYIPTEPYEAAIDEIPVITVVTTAGDKSLTLENSMVIQMSDQYE